MSNTPQENLTASYIRGKIPHMQSTLSNIFSAEVRANLARRGLRVTDIASHLGISEATAYRWMSPRGEWPLNEAGIAAEFFGFDSLVSMIRAGQRIAS